MQQEQVSESTTTLLLKNLEPNTEYTVTVVPVYAEGDGPELDENGKTSEYCEVEFCLSIAITLPNIFPNFLFFFALLFFQSLWVLLKICK